VVKGQAGSPYAITDYYDIDPDLAVDVDCRMAEFEALVDRTHKAGMKVIIDFVPNHVAREYRSVRLPEGVRDLGADDDQGKHFSPQNNFYYFPGEPFVQSRATPGRAREPYHEFPAKCTGQRPLRPTAEPERDWFETVKLKLRHRLLRHAGGRSSLFEPRARHVGQDEKTSCSSGPPRASTASACDMAEMVPPAFWA
jgi:hypothetical protein